MVKGLQKDSKQGGKRQGTIRYLKFTTTALRKGKAIVVNSSKIKIMRTEAKTPSREFSLEVISCLIKQLLQHLTWNYPRLTDGHRLVPTVYFSMPDDTPVKQISSTCFQDHCGCWNSLIALYMATKVGSLLLEPTRAYCPPPFGSLLRTFSKPFTIVKIGTSRLC